MSYSKFYFAKVKFICVGSKYLTKTSQDQSLKKNVLKCKNIRCLNKRNINKIPKALR